MTTSKCLQNEIPCKTPFFLIILSFQYGDTTTSLDEFMFGRKQIIDMEGCSSG